MKLRDCEIMAIQKLKKYDVDEEIEYLVTFLSYNAKHGSLEDVLGLDEEQLTIAGMLLRLADDAENANCSPNPEKEIQRAVRRAYYRSKSFRRNAIEIKESGDIEDYLSEYRKDGEYYVPLSEQEVIYGGVEAKPQTIDRLYAHAIPREKYVVHKTYGKKVYGDCYHEYHLREQVGFDKMQFQVMIDEVDMTKLEHAETDLQQESYDCLPRVLTDHTNDRDLNDRPLRLPGIPSETHTFKRIEVTLSHHVTFKFQRNNSSDNRGDIYILETTVEPDEGHEILGNFRNYSYDEMKAVILQAMDELEELTGIKVDRQEVRINQAEINLTFRQNCRFDYLLRSVSYYQAFCREGYQTEKHFAEMDDKDAYEPLRTTGMTTKNKTVAVKLYDKKEETKKYALEKYLMKVDMDADFIEGNYSIVRLEFAIRTQRQIERYFHETNFMSMSQNMIEVIYQELVHHFFEVTYKKYAKMSQEILKKIVANLDTSREGNWRLQLVKDVLSQEIVQQSTPALLAEMDIDDEVLKANRTFSMHPRKYRGEIRELLEESDGFPHGQKNAYGMLLNFLTKTSHLETLSQNRRIGYVAAPQASSFWDGKDSEMGIAIIEGMSD